MRSEHGKRLESVVRVLALCEANPDPGAGFSSIIAQLSEGRSRAESLAAQQRLGLLDVTAAATVRKQIRRNLHHNYLVPITRFAELGEPEEPGLNKLFKLPEWNARNQVWRTAARAFLTGVTARKDLFIKNGMTEAMLGDFSAALDEYDAATDRFNAARSAHVGATAELDDVMRFNAQLIELLDGINRYRFKNDSEKLAAWESARSLPTASSENGADGADEADTPDTPLAPAAWAKSGETEKRKKEKGRNGTAGSSVSPFSVSTSIEACSCDA